MASCGYTEANFIDAFNTELRLTNITSTVPHNPSQRAEKKLGYDWAYRLNTPLFYPIILSGVFLDDPDFAFHLDLEKRRLPHFKVNAFVQFKAPDYMVSTQAKEWGDWKQPYFRFRTSLEQQKVLERIESIWGYQVMSGYVCPAIFGFSGLQEASENQDILSLSRYTLPSDMHGHRVMSFVDSNGDAKKHSEVEEQANRDFSSELSQRLERADEKSVAELVSDAALIILESTRKWEPGSDLPFDEYGRFQNIIERFELRDYENNYIKQIFLISVFRYIFNIDLWMFG